MVNWSIKINCTLFVLLSFSSANLFAQSDQISYCINVLKDSSIGKTYCFMNRMDSSETYFKYIGEVKSEKGSIYRIVTSTWIWGISHRVTNRILVFNSLYKYLGNYYLNTASELPDIIKKNRLIFINENNNECDKITEISFAKGIPQKIFLKCKDDDGSIYVFEKD